MYQDLFQTQIGESTVVFKIDDHLIYFGIVAPLLAVISFFLFKRETWWSMIRWTIASILISILFLFITEYASDEDKSVIYLDLEDKGFYFFFTITSLFVLSFQLLKRSKNGTIVFTICSISFLIYFFMALFKLQSESSDLGDAVVFVIVTAGISILMILFSLIYWRLLKKSGNKN